MARPSKNAALVVANTAAMQAVVALSDTVDANAIRAMHRALMLNDPRHTPGEFRAEPVWSGGRPLRSVRRSSARAMS